MVIIETSVFTRLIKQLMPDSHYRELQNALVDCPDKGEIIQGSGGLRKLRWRAGNRGKSGGVRCIYYWQSDKAQIYMVYAYPKSQQTDLSFAQRRTLRQIVERWSNEN